MGICLAGLIILAGCQSTENDTFKMNVKSALDHYYRGVELQKKRDYAGAKQELQASLDISPRPRTYLQLAALALEQNELEEAGKYADLTLKLSPNNSIARTLKRQVEIRKGLGAAGAMTPTSPPGTIVPLSSTGSAPPVTPAVPASPPSTMVTAPTLEQVAAPPGDEITALLNQVKADSSAGRWQEALAQCDQILQKSPDNPQAHYQKGVALFQLKNFAEAERSLKKAIELKPDYADAYNDLGITLEYLERSIEAVQAYQKAIEIGTNRDAYFNLAILEEKRGDYKQSIEHYENYLKYDNSSVYADFARNRIEKLRRQEF